MPRPALLLLILALAATIQAQSPEASYKAAKAIFAKHTSGGAIVCLYPDDLGIFNFTLRRTPDGGYFITRIRPSKASECAQPSYLPFTPAEEPVPHS